MAVPGEGHRVRHRLERLDLRIGVASVSAAAGCCVADRIVREVEKRFLRVKRTAVLRKPRIRLLVPALAFPPFGADEVVSLHGAAANRRERLVEHLLPAFLHSEFCEGFVLGVALHMHVKRHVAVPVALVVVVAGAEQLLNLASIRRTVVREHTVPCVCHISEPALQAPVAQVSGDDHGIHLAVAEILERPPERDRGFGRGDVDVAYNAEGEIRLWPADAKRTASAHSHESGRAAEEVPSA